MVGRLRKRMLQGLLCFPAILKWIPMSCKHCLTFPDLPDMSRLLSSMYQLRSAPRKESLVWKWGWQDRKRVHLSSTYLLLDFYIYVDIYQYIWHIYTYMYTHIHCYYSLCSLNYSAQEKSEIICFPFFLVILLFYVLWSVCLKCSTFTNIPFHLYFKYEMILHDQTFQEMIIWYLSNLFLKSRSATNSALTRHISPKGNRLF